MAPLLSSKVEEVVRVLLDLGTVPLRSPSLLCLCGAVDFSHGFISEVIDAQNDLDSLLQFDYFTKGVWKDQVVRKLLSLGHSNHALFYLEDGGNTCDETTFQMVIRAAGKDTYESVKSVFNTMQTLGYRRTVHEFEKVICDAEPIESYGLFLKMTQECPEEAATAACYQSALRGCSTLDNAWTVLKEAKSKGVSGLDVCDCVISLLGSGDDDITTGLINSAADLIRGVGNVDFVASNVLQKIRYKRAGTAI